MQCYNQGSKRWYYPAALLLFFLYCSATRAQRPFAREYWLSDAATPERIHALAQDPVGYIWAGTDGGVYRFNGSSFTVFQDAAGAPVTAIGISENTVWVGFRNGAIGRVSHEKNITLLHKPSQPGKAITGIIPAGGGNVLITTEDKILLAGPQGIHNISAKGGRLPEAYLYSLNPLSASRALLASDNGLTDIRYNGKSWTSADISTGDGLPDPILRVIKPIPHKDLCWLGTQEGGIALYSTITRKAWVPYSAGDWSWGQVNDILPVSESRAYAVTESGYLLELFLTDSLHLHITAHHYAGKVLNVLLADKTGNLWCATNENLLKISVPYVGYMPLDKPYALRELTAMTCDQSNNLWLAQDNLLYAQQIADGGKQPRLVAKAPSGITSLFADRERRLWVGTLGDGLWYLPDGGTALLPASIPALQSENMLSVAGTEKSLWTASLSGVHEITYPDKQGVQRILQHHTKASGIGTDYVYQIYPDSKGCIWMATDGAGVAMYDRSSYHRWNGDRDIKVAYAITEDAGGDIWAATLEKGLYRYHAGAWSRYGREEGLQELAISSLCATNSGIVIAVNQQGIDQWYPGSRQFRHYNRRLALDIDSMSSVLNCIAKDKAGNVYVPFEHGIIRFRNEAARFDIRPAVRIAQIALFMAPLAYSRRAFASDENYLSFFFDGLNYTNPESLHYRYKLEGYNNNWIQTGDNRVTFPQLPPGEYTFRLQGSLNQHFTQAGEASYSFTIAPPLWRRPWFIVLAFVVVCLIAWYLLRLRDKSMNNLMRLRQERLAFEYEHLKSQVNPHFLFNSLNTLTGLIEDGDKELATTYTVQLSDLYRNMLAYRDRDLILLSEEWDILSAYLHIQRSRFEDAFEVRTEIPESVMQTKRIVPMALQLLVENAIKHNIVSQSNPLVIHIKADEKMIVVSNPLHPKVSPPKGAGLGLRHIKRRYELLTDRKITFGPSDGHYIVSLPLL